MTPILALTAIIWMAWDRRSLTAAVLGIVSLVGLAIEELLT